MVSRVKMQLLVLVISILMCAIVRHLQVLAITFESWPLWPFTRVDAHPVNTSNDRQSSHFFGFS